RDAKGTGVVRMWNPSNLGNNEFLMWGHDNVARASSTTSGVGAPIEERLSRTWRVSESGDVGNVSISFDFSGVGGSPIGSSLRLLIDRNGNGFGDNDVTPIVGTVSNGIAVFSNVNFQNGDRFTLGNTDALSPLPVSLISFEALPTNELVLVKWKTESELNNEEFTVEKSNDAEHWEEVSTVAGAGTSVESKNYQILDFNPLHGRSYYRLKQTDFDGKFDYSEIVAVEFSGRSTLLVSPNPTQGSFVIKGQDISTDQVRVFNAQGALIIPRKFIENGELQVDMSSFSSGVYIVRVSDGTGIRTTRLVKY
ncbi:MAG: T9SS type A sorting domain-containing protein, partial [Cyclobacteriaceae bacterium]